MLVEVSAPAATRGATAAYDRMSRETGNRVLFMGEFEMIGEEGGVVLSSGEDLFDQCKFLFGEGEVVENLDILGDLFRPARTDQGGCHGRQAKDPGQCHLCQGLPPLQGQSVEFPDPAHDFVGDVIGLQKTLVPSRAGIRRDSVEIAAGKQSLGQGEKTMHPIPLCSRASKRPLFSGVRSNMLYLG